MKEDRESILERLKDAQTVASERLTTIKELKESANVVMEKHAELEEMLAAAIAEIYVWRELTASLVSRCVGTSLAYKRKGDGK